jgi:hypothetical protein
MSHRLVFIPPTKSSIALYLTEPQKWVREDGIRVGSYALPMRGTFVSMIGQDEGHHQPPSTYALPRECIGSLWCSVACILFNKIMFYSNFFEKKCFLGEDLVKIIHECYRIGNDHTSNSPDCPISCIPIASFSQDCPISHIQITRSLISCIPIALLSPDRPIYHIVITRSSISYIPIASFSPDRSISCIAIVSSQQSGEYHA